MHNRVLLFQINLQLDDQCRNIRYGLLSDNLRVLLGYLNQADLVLREEEFVLEVRLPDVEHAGLGVLWVVLEGDEDLEGAVELLLVEFVGQAY